MSASKTVYVFSDSHGKTDDMTRLAKAGRPDMIIHAGDYASDARKVQQDTGILCHAVKGNCDYFDNEETIREVFLMGQKLIVTHGDKYAVKYSYDRLWYLAREQDAKAVIFGHTHEAFCEYVDGIWLVNPGSISLPRGSMPSYAELVVGNFGVVPKIKYYSGG